jgi:hypothetical protein
MRIFLLHSQDDPERGFWIRSDWDRTIDMAWTRPQASRSRSKGTVEQLPNLQRADFDCLRRALEFGLNRLIDDQGLDWWDLITIQFYEQIGEILKLRRFAQSCAPDDEILLSRDGFHSQALHFLFRGRIHCFSSRRPVRERLQRTAALALKFRPSQILEILGDKYDQGYRLRRLFSRPLRSGTRDVVLLPTAYVNASRMALEYAEALPDQEFLLVTTRRSGWIQNPPRNVRVANLASYAPGRVCESGSNSLSESWHELLADLRENPDLSILEQLEAFASVPALLRDGLAVRDAWLRVFEREPVASVLCADEINPYTRLPLLLAQRRDLPAIACHHGALDCRYLFKSVSADVLLAKGAMERDYLVNYCGVRESKVEVAAPPRCVTWSRPQEETSVVFFSEPYESMGGRCGDVYAQVLPQLVDIAAQKGVPLTVKLHPYESYRERKKLVARLLNRKQRNAVRVVDGPLTQELLTSTWFAVTLCSSAAVDCALQGIPTFLCAWLGGSNYGYAEQFIKFGAASRLRRPEEISQIPRLLESGAAIDPTRLWQAVRPEQLRRLLLQPSVSRDQARYEIAEKVWA